MMHFENGVLHMAELDFLFKLSVILKEELPEARYIIPILSSRFGSSAFACYNEIE